MSDKPVFWQRQPGWIRYACACGYTMETIYAGPSANARACGLCNAIVVGDRFMLDGSPPPSVED